MNYQNITIADRIASLTFLIFVVPMWALKLSIVDPIKSSLASYDFEDEKPDTLYYQGFDEIRYFYMEGNDEEEANLLDYIGIGVITGALLIGTILECFLRSVIESLKYLVWALSHILILLSPINKEDLDDFFYPRKLEALERSIKFIPPEERQLPLFSNQSQEEDNQSVSSDCGTSNSLASFNTAVSSTSLIVLMTFLSTVLIAAAEETNIGHGLQF